jgi:hypothetical protein
VKNNKVYSSAADLVGKSAATCTVSDGTIPDVLDSQGNPIAKGMKVTCGTIVKPYTVYSVKNNKVYSSAADLVGKSASTCTVSDGTVPETTPPDTGPGPDAVDETVDEPVVGPEGSTDNVDGTFTTEDGSIVDSTGNPLQEDPENPGKYLTADGAPFVAPKPKKVTTGKTGKTGKTGTAKGPQGSQSNGDGTFTAADGSIVDSAGNPLQEDPDNPGSYLTADGTPFVASTAGEGEEGGDDTAVCGIAGVTGGPGGTIAKFAPRANSPVPIQISAEQLPEGQLLSPVAEWSNGDIKHNGAVSYIFTEWQGKIYCITGTDANEISRKVSALKKQNPISLTKEVLSYMMSEYNGSQLDDMRKASDLLGLLKVSSDTADTTVQPSIQGLEKSLSKVITAQRGSLESTQKVITSAAAAAAGGGTRKRRPHSKSYKSGRKYAKKSAKKSAKRR